MSNVRAGSCSCAGRNRNLKLVPALRGTNTQFSTNKFSIVFGVSDASYRAAGREAGIRQLVDAFFARMGSDERFKTISDMHPEDKEVSRDKLARFLRKVCGGASQDSQNCEPRHIRRLRDVGLLYSALN